MEFLPFGFGCDCGQPIVVKPDERHQPIKCLACGKLHGPFGDTPALESLPARDSSFIELIRFADAYNSAPHFRKRWGDDYQSNVGSLSGRYVQAYKSGALASGPLDELLLCLAHDVAVGPYLGVPEPHTLAFLRWLIDGIRQKIRCPVG